MALVIVRLRFSTTSGRKPKPDFSPKGPSLAKGTEKRSGWRNGLNQGWGGCLCLSPCLRSEALTRDFP